MISNIPDLNSAKVETNKDKENIDDVSAKIDMDPVFESDLTTDTETDAEAGFNAARKSSIQRELIRKLKEEYAEIGSYRERLKINIENYGKFLNQIDFGSVEDESSSEHLDNLYDLLDEHKKMMMLIFGDDHMDIKSSIKAIILKQVLNKKGVYVDISGKYSFSSKLWYLAQNKIIINPIVRVRDTEFKISHRSDCLGLCPHCNQWYYSFSSCMYCKAKETTDTVEQRDSFKTKFLVVLYTQINSANIENNDGKRSRVGHSYNSDSWLEKLFTLFSMDDVQRYKPPEIGKPE